MPAIKCIIPFLSPLIHIISLSRCSPSNDHETTTIANVARRLLAPLVIPAATSCMWHAIYRCTSIRGQKRGPPRGDRLPYSLPLFKAPLNDFRGDGGLCPSPHRDFHQSNNATRNDNSTRVHVHHVRCITRHRVHFADLRH